MNPWDHSAPGWGQIPPGYSQPEPAHGGYWQQPAWTEPKEGFFHSTSTSLAMRPQPANKKMRRLSQDLTSVLHWLLADRFTSKSRRYPSLHPILAADTTQARVDVRFHSSSGKAIPDATYYAYRHAYATATQASHIRLISKDFPWSIDIKTTGNPVTCDDVWSALHTALQKSLADSEWGALSHDPSDAKKVQKAAKQRQSEVDKDKTLKRVDWLADGFIFRGLEKDDDFAKRRLAYVDSECQETWVVKMVAQ
jgi:hypothetical protein